VQAAIVQAATLEVDPSPTLKAPLIASQQAIIWSKGADVASATALNLGSDGNSFDITGTTTITSIATEGVGTWAALQFDGALTFTHHATNLILPGGANITTAAGDIAIMYEYATGDWRCMSYQIAARSPNKVGRILQRVTTKTSAVATGTTTMPVDDTIPQNTEGDEYMTLAITPISATGTLHITAVLNVASSVNAIKLTAALFVDSTAGAIAAVSNEMSGADDLEVITLVLPDLSSASTTARTYKVRAGPISAATLTLNGQAAGRIFGGVLYSSITITEYE